MEKNCQVWIARNQDLGEVNSLIDFLEWAREMLKVREGAELVVRYHPDEDAIDYELLGGPDEPIRRYRLGAPSY